MARRFRATGAACAGLSLGLTGASAVTTGLLGVALTSDTVKADTTTSVWNGSTSTVWSTAGNWSNGVPNPTVSAVFNSSYTNQPGFTANPGTIQGFWFDTGLTQDFTHGGQNFTVGIAGTATLGGLTNAGILMSDSGNHNVTIARTSFVNSTNIYMNQAGTLTLPTALGLPAGGTLTLRGNNSAGIVNISAALSATTLAPSALEINTAGTVNLSGSNGFSTVGSIGLILDAGTLTVGRNNTVGQGTIVFNGGTFDTLNSGINFSGASSFSNAIIWNGDWTFKGTNTLNTGVGSLNLGSAAGTTRSVAVIGNALTMGNVISNGTTANSITKTGNGSLFLQGNNAFDGSLSIRGGTLTVNNLGKVATASGYNVVSSTFTVDNSTSLAAGRLNSGSTLSLQNGAFGLTGHASAGSTDETVGTLALDSGANTITLTQAASTNISTRLTATNLTRSNNAVALVRATGTLGSSNFGTSTTTQFRVTNNPTADLVGGGGSFTSGTDATISIVPYLIADTIGATSGVTLLGYDSNTDSLRALKSTEYATLATATANSNVRNASASTAVAVAAGAYNSLNLFQQAQQSGTQTDTLGGAVTLGSGALLFTQQTNNTTLRDAIMTGGQLQFATREGVISNINGKNAQIDTQISGSGGVTFNTFLLGTSVSSITINSTANDWTGNTTLNGVIKLGQAGVLPDGSKLFMGQGASLDLAGNSETVDALAGTGTIDTLTASSTPTLTIGSANGGATFSGVIQNTGAGSALTVTKTGNGTQIFTNANTYSGGTNISGGKLLANNTTSSTGSGAVNVQGGGTLGGTGKVAGAVTVLNNGILLAGDGTTGTTLTIGSDLTMNSGSSLDLAVSSSGAHSTLARGGGTWTFDANQGVLLLEVNALTGTETYDNVVSGLAVNPGSLAGWHLLNNDVTGVFTYDGSGGIDLALSPVPEPAGMAVVGGLALGLLSRRRRRAKANA